MKSEQVDVEMSLYTVGVGVLIFSPVVQGLTAVEIVKAVLFVEAGVCQAAGCAVASGD
jgi:hypothetical protein